MRWLNLSDVSNFRKPSMVLKLITKYPCRLSPSTCGSHQRCTDVLEIPPFFRKCLRLCTGITKNQSLTDSGLTLDRMMWIRTNDHKVMNLNPETEDVTENICTGFYKAKTPLFSYKDLDWNGHLVCPSIRTMLIFLWIIYNKDVRIPKTYQHG